MQSKREIHQTEMTLAPSLDALVPRTHWLYRLNQVLDLGFVHESVRPCYCQDNGRPSIDPEVIVRLFLLQAITGIGSVRSLLEEVNLHMGYRWFIGYGLSEPLPDHSTLSKVMDRLGDTVFNEVFTRSIAQCRASGLIDGKIVHVDATTIRADLDANRVGTVDSPDPEARLGRFPGGKKAPGYKQATVADGQSRVVVGVKVFPANRADDTEMVSLIDEVRDHLGAAPEAVCGDMSYGSGQNRAALEERGIRLVSPAQKPVTCAGRDGFTVEDFSYDEQRDEFTCPAGAILRYIGLDTTRSGRRRYRASKAACRDCVLRERCTRHQYRTIQVGSHHAALIRLRADSRTASFRQFYRSRAPVIEGVFAEAKQWHGLRRAWRRGLAKMRVQCLLIAAVMNFKRLAAAFIGFSVVLSISDAFRRLIRRFLTRSWRSNYSLAALTDNV
ncbi:MAG: transposase [candidate division Zixibacteria bacterium]|nr:transposase [candidate division Zixibacteria bacterium]